MAIMPTLMMKLAMPVFPYPAFPRKREKGQTRKAIFTLTDGGFAKIAKQSMPACRRHNVATTKPGNAGLCG